MVLGALHKETVAHSPAKGQRAECQPSRHTLNLWYTFSNPTILEANTMRTWLKDNGGGFIAIGALLTFLQFFVVTPLRNQSNQNFETLRREMNARFDAQDKYINQRFDAVDQRFDAQDRRIEDLAKDVSELRTLSERVSRNEGRVDAIMEQLQTADAPSP